MDKYAVEAFLFSEDFGEDYHLLASSSSDSDFECCCSDNSESSIEKLQLKRLKVEGFAEINVPLFEESDFKKHFRVSRSVCKKITELIHSNFSSEHKGGWDKITPAKAAYVLLWYLANRETFKQISDRFRITKSCVYNIVKVGCQNLSSNLPNFIKWPEDAKRAEESEVFFNKCKISGIIGAVAMSHIETLHLKDEFEKYNNTKNYCSIAVQGTVGSKNNFIDLYVCEGSLESYEALNKSSLPEKAYEPNYFLVGDSAYPTDRWLVTSFPNADGLTSEQEEFNRYLSKAYRCAYDAFGMLKERFDRLNQLDNKSIPFIIECIKAACVIHNICIEQGDDYECFSSDDGIFDCEYTFQGEDSERREEVFSEFVNCGSVSDTMN